jgi:hypothetical protein
METKQDSSLIVSGDMRNKCIIFLDNDGVLNSELFYKEQFSEITPVDGVPIHKIVKKHLRRMLKKLSLSKLDYYRSQICPIKISWINGLCDTTDSVVVLSASMRAQWSISELQAIFNYCGATFTIIDKTPHTGYERGTEVNKWLEDNFNEETHGCKSFDFKKYAIIDDDDDFFINQAPHLFQTDSYVGLTPNTCDKIRIFLTGKTFTE